MTAYPGFASIPRIAAAAISTANANVDGTGTVVTVFTAGASGSKVFEISIQATVNPADSMIHVFLHDGATYYLFDTFDMGDPATGSTTVPPYRDTRAYDNLLLPASWSIRALITVAPTSGVVNMIVHGADF